MEIKRSVLIVEDEPVMRQAIREVLGMLEGYEIYEASDGIEGLRLIDELQPNVVLLDLLMPRMDGFEVLKTLEAREEPPRDTKILVLTALAEPSLVEMLQHLGAYRV